MVKRIAKGVFVMVAFGAPTLFAAPKVEWPEHIQEKMIVLDRRADGELGVYVKDLSSGAEYSFRGEEDWYLASGVKVPVAVELLRQAEKGEISLFDTVELREEDLIDGSPVLSRLKPGSRLSLHYLLEQMITWSDNTASDLLIRAVGLGKVNRNTQRLSPGFHDITTLSDVRRIAYGGIYAKARELKNRDLLRLKKVGERKRVRALASLLSESPAAARAKTVDSAFTAYYARKLNSAPLAAYGRLLEKVVEGEALQPDSRDLLIQTMERTHTGKDRLRAAFHPAIVWAHKTGTQHARICDFGYAWPAADPSRKVVIATCARGFSSRRKAERALRSVGEAIRTSGIFPIL